MLSLDVSVLQHLVLPLEVCLFYGSRRCTWTCLFYGSLCFPTFLFCSSLCCHRTCLFYSGLCCPLTCIFHSRLDVSLCLFYTSMYCASPACICSTPVCAVPGVLDCLSIRACTAPTKACAALMRVCLLYKSFCDTPGRVCFYDPVLHLCVSVYKCFVLHLDMSVHNILSCFCSFLSTITFPCT